MLRCTVEEWIVAPAIVARFQVSFAVAYGGNRNKRYRLHHDSVRGGLPNLTSTACARGVAADATASNHTVARMPQGKAKSGCPHEPQRPRLPLGDRFGMLPPGVSVVVEAVTMR
jgi:hypothetical protein